MKNRAIYILATAALAATAFAQQQTPPATAPNPSVAPDAKQAQPAKPDAPATDPTATTSTTPAPPASATQDKSVTPDTQSRDAQRSTQTAQPTQSQLPQSDASIASLDNSGLTAAQLQQKIEAAIHSEPTLSGSDLTVNVTDDEINVSGTVGSGKDRTTASRIVNSFGENRKVKEKINVSGVKK